MRERAAERYDPLPDLASLLDAALRRGWGSGAERIAERLRLDPYAGPGAAEKALREAAGLNAARHFTETWRELVADLPDDYECHMNCAEANAAAGLWEAFGDPGTARALMAAHAARDEEGDQHWEAAP